MKIVENECSEIIAMSDQIRNCTNDLTEIFIRKKYPKYVTSVSMSLLLGMLKAEGVEVNSDKIMAQMEGIINSEKIKIL